MQEPRKIGAVILAGGSAKRLNGISKGKLMLEEGVTIIYHTIGEIKKCGIGKIIISANEDSSYVEYGLPIIKDSYHNCGPLAGIESSLKYYQNHIDSMFFVPCDLPNISTKEIKVLVKYYLEEKFKVVFAAASDGKHPLCGIIDISCLSDVTMAIYDGIRKPILVWQLLGAKCLEFGEDGAFKNINTADDLETFRDD